MTATTLAYSADIATAALVTISGMRLVLPQVDIGALESAADVDTREPGPYSVGWIQYLQKRWPVYCLSPNLELLTKIPNERRACILLASGDEYIGFLCDEVRIARQAELGEQQKVPSIMRMPNTPIIGLIPVNEDEIGSLTCAEKLVAYVNRLVKI